MRQIEPKMLAWLDQRLILNGLAQTAIETRNARQLMIEAAKACVGIREKTNRNDGPMVELIQSTVGRAHGEAWCLSFVMTCIAYAEVRTGIKSPLAATEHCMTLWRNTPETQKVKRHPLPGAIAIWRHGSSTNGHTGIVLGADESTFTCVEGNTSSGQTPTGEIVREGGGVYFTERSMQNFPNLRTGGTMKLQGFIRPFA
jgi:hypothetical protein